MTSDEIIDEIVKKAHSLSSEKIRHEFRVQLCALVALAKAEQHRDDNPDPSEFGRRQRTFMH